jgi:glycine hydroxymethyltransferase
MERTVAGARTIAEVLVAESGRIGAEVVTGGTDVHQLLVDLGVSDRDSGTEMARLNTLGISANCIPLAFAKATLPAVSGVRFGAAALASRGFGPAEFAEVGSILADALVPGGGHDQSVAARVRQLTAAWPLYGHLG